jgi:hypothetical protein
VNRRNAAAHKGFAAAHKPPDQSSQDMPQSGEKIYFRPKIGGPAEENSINPLFGSPFLWFYGCSRGAPDAVNARLHSLTMTTAKPSASAAGFVCARATLALKKALKVTLISTLPGAERP